MILPKNKKKNIFVTTGSSLEFNSLIKYIDLVNKDKSYNVVCQIGKGSYIPKNCKYFKFDKSLDKYVDWSDLVITHTGVGTLFELLYKNKKIISINNPLAISNHDLVIKFNNLNYLSFLEFSCINNLDKLLKDIFNNNVKFKKYKSENNFIFKEIKKYL